MKIKDELELNLNMNEAKCDQQGIFQNMLKTLREPNWTTTTYKLKYPTPTTIPNTINWDLMLSHWVSCGYLLLHLHSLMKTVVYIYTIIGNKFVRHMHAPSYLSTNRYMFQKGKR